MEVVRNFPFACREERCHKEIEEITFSFFAEFAKDSNRFPFSFSLPTCICLATLVCHWYTSTMCLHMGVLGWWTFFIQLHSLLASTQFPPLFFFIFSYFFSKRHITAMVDQGPRRTAKSTRAGTNSRIAADGHSQLWSCIFYYLWLIDKKTANQPAREALKFHFYNVYSPFSLSDFTSSWSNIGFTTCTAFILSWQ